MSFSRNGIAVFLPMGIGVGTTIVTIIIHAFELVARNCSVFGADIFGTGY